MKKLKRLMAGILAVIILLSDINFNQFISAKGDQQFTTLYFIDNTAEQWVKNDNAKLMAVDNTNGHTSYLMTQVTESLWKATVPISAYNITFNRYNPDGTLQWNSWSAGGRDLYNAYYADGSEYGHWDTYSENKSYFHAGDVIYLNISEFTLWENDNAVMYANFTNASKTDNKDILLSYADNTKYKPIKVQNKAETYVYQYIVTKESEGARELRFWRGNDFTLWNNSLVLSYDDYINGLNCVNVTGWNNQGSLSSYKTSLNWEMDSDNDGAPDYVEDYFGTDKTKEDTDGDGVSDFAEIYSTVLNPIIPDTDGNGINDGDEDTDGDGLSNIEELRIGTSIVDPDTDNDGLSDYDEIAVYKTEPLKYDTDGDGVSDGKEIELGTNPLTADTSFSVCVKASENDTVNVSVTAELSGNQAESLSVKKYNNDLYFPETMPGYIGDAYDFHVDGNLDSAVIKFEFNKNLLNDELFEPVIYYFNEETQLLEELETTVTGNCASAKVSHFSKYILLNRRVFNNSFEWQDVWSTQGYSGVEVVLLIDDSDSMKKNDKKNQRLTVARSLVDKLPANTKAGIVRFASTPSILTSSLTSDKEVAKSYLTTSYFKSSGSTHMYRAINKSFSLFESTDDNILKMMVVLSDGSTSDSKLHSSIVTSANNMKVKIFTVGLEAGSSDYFLKYLKPLANNTGGKFYLASDAEHLDYIFDDINKKIDIETDSDDDGIPDYYEDNMVMFNGVKIKLDKNNPDSDGDGLPDGEEIDKLNYQYNKDKTKVIVTGKLLSNPLLIDTDGDGISDEEEYNIGTNPISTDTDGDGLSDGIEFTNWFNPLDKDPDKDKRLDLREYLEGTDPFTYNKNWYEHVWDFTCGFIAGDFISDTDSLPTIMGQITSSLIPYVDLRDVIGNLTNGDYAFAGLSAIGLVPIAGDAGKAAGKAGKFALKNINDIPKVAGLIEFLNKNFPDAVKLLSKSDDFIDAAKKLSKTDCIKLTRNQAKILTEAFENAGLSHYLIKTGNSLDVKKSVDIGAEVWEQGALKRGIDIDEFINKHSLGKGLGKNFPVADRIEDMTLVSTKSLDIGAPSYQNSKTLKRTLNKYANALNNFESKYFKGYDEFYWGTRNIKKSDYNKKALEIILPDIIITEDTLEVLKTFQKSSKENGIEVWYILTK